MAARYWIEANHEGFHELANELRRLAKIADSCGKTLAENKSTHRSDQFNKAVVGLESLIELFREVNGPYSVEGPLVEQFSRLLDVEKATKKTAAEATAQKLLEAEAASEKGKRAEKHAQSQVSSGGRTNRKRPTR